MGSSALTATSRTVLVSTGVGLAAFIFHLQAIGRPGPWGDELVTVLSVRRDLDSLATSLRIHDVVHGPYYVAGHLWGSMVGTDLVALRALSALSVAVATALMVVLGSMLLGLRFGIYAALVFTTLPRMMWAATEARSSALVTAAVIAAITAFLAALRRDSRCLWVLYGLLLVISVHVFEFAALCFMALPVVVAAARPPRRAVIRFGLTTATAALVCVPFLLQTVRQSDTVNWIAQGFTVHGALKAIGTSQFLSQDGVPRRGALDAMVWLIAIAGIVLAGWRARTDPDARVAVSLATAWLILPTAVLLGYSVLVTPVFEQRYLASSAPALALAVALAVFYVPAPRNVAVGPILLVLVMLLSVGAWTHYHAVYAKSGWIQTAQAVAAIKQPGDVVVAAGPLEANAAAVMPAEFSGLPVINVTVPYYADNTPLGQVSTLRDNPGLLDGHRRVWYLAENGIDDADAAVFAHEGFTERERIEQYRLGAILYERG